MNPDALALPVALFPESPGEAFSTGFAAAMRNLHVNAGGEAAGADVVHQAALRAAEAIQTGKTWFDLTSIGADVLHLRASPVVMEAETSQGTAPLVIFGERLYLARYWTYERSLYTSLSTRNCAVEGVDEAQLRKELDRHFADKAAPAPNWQKIAAATAVLRRLCVISGGPGTGKTTTVVRILAILLTLDSSLKIAIAAPTGKAAARVQESIRLQIDSLQLPDAVKAAMPGEPHTIHRLLGYIPGHTAFRYNRSNRLPYDVVVVDEASMLDIALAAKLTEALSDDARLILLGDKDQLSSVEAGAVYSGISSERYFSPEWKKTIESITGQSFEALPASEATGGLTDSVVWLEHSYRFGSHSVLGRLARAINTTDLAALDTLLATSDPALSWSGKYPSPKALVEHLMMGFESYAQAVQSNLPADEVFRAFDRFRVLCSTREGSYGSANLGALLASALRRRLGEPHGNQSWFTGRPVLVTANDYALRLFNGDVGILLPDDEGDLVVKFQLAEGTTRKVSPNRIGAVQDAMAITVHRAQGSEFERVAIVVEPHVLRGLSKQLLYTAVTRAKSEVSLWCQNEVFTGIAS